MDKPAPAEKRLFGYDPDTGITEYWIDTEPGNEHGGFAIQTVQDVEPILDANKELQTYGAAHYKQDSQEGSWWHAARIPLTFQLHFLDKYGINIYSDDPTHMQALDKKLNDPDYRFLRVGDFTI